MDRWRAARQRGPGRAAADGDALAARLAQRRRDAAHPRRRDRPLRPRQSGRDGPGLALVHAQSRPAAALAGQPAAALSEVHRPRQQPGLLRLHAAGDGEHEPGDVHAVVPADRLQPPPDGAHGHGDVRAPLPRPLQLRLRPAGPRCHRPGGRGDAHPLRGRGEARRHHAPREQLQHVVERRAADDGVLPQHDRPAHGDDRQPHAHRHPVRGRAAAPPRRPAVPHRAAALALPAVDRLLGHRQLRGARRGQPLPRAVPLAHLADGEELHRARQPRHVDHVPQPPGRRARFHRRAAGRALARRGDGARRPVPGRAERRGFARLPGHAAPPRVA